jgi:outer membrane protein
LHQTKILPGGVSVRNSIRKSWLVFCAALLFSVSASFAETIELTLDDAIELAIKNSDEVKIRQLALSSSSKDLKAAKASYYPDVAVSSSYSHSFTENDQAAVFGSHDSDQLDLSLDLNQTIYTFGGLKASVEAAQRSGDIAKLDLEEAKRGIAVEIQRSFYGYLLAREMFAVKEESLRYKEEALEVARIRYDTGLTTRREVLQAESDLKSFVPELISARNDIELSLLTLRDILGIEDRADVVIKGELDVSDAQLDRERLLQEAIDQNSSLERQKMSIALQKVQGEIVRAGRLPVISGFAGASLQNGFDIGGGECIGGEWDTTISAGIRIRMDLSSLFPWSADTADMEKNSIELEKMNTELKSLRDSIRLNVESILLGLSEGSAKMEAGEKALELAKELFLVSKESYENGLISSMEYEDAQLQLKDAKLEFLTYIYNYRMSLCDLMDAIGKDQI